MADGLSQSQVHAIVEDQNGYIWMGTRGGGLSRFNGIRFDPFNSSNGLCGNHINALEIDDRGRLWIGTTEGLSVYDKNAFRCFPGIEGNVTHLISEPNHLWVITEHAIYDRRDETLIPLLDLHREELGRIESVWKEDGFFWIGTSVGLFELEPRPDGTLLVKTRMLKGKMVTSLVRDAYDHLWIGTYGKGLYLKMKDDLVDMRYSVRIRDEVINDLFVDREENIWIATQSNGIVKYNLAGNNRTQITDKEGLPINNIRCFYEDRWNQVWIGTNGGGVSKFAGLQFRGYTMNDGLSGNYIYAVCADDKGTLWVSGSKGGVDRLTGAGVETYQRDSGFTSSKVKSIYHEGHRMWFGTEGDGLYLFDANKFHHFDTDSGLSGNWVKHITKDDQQKLWVATADGGISILDLSAENSSVVETISKNEGLISNRVVRLIRDADGNMWYGTAASGMGVIGKDGSIQNYTVHDGLSGNAIRSFALDSLGNLWVASSKGLDVLNVNIPRPAFMPIEDDRLFSSNFYFVETDPQGFLWIGTEKGIGSIAYDEQLNILEVDHYDYHDGFTGVECNLNAAGFDQSGSLWVGTINGLFNFLGNNRVNGEILPTPHFTDVLLNYRSVGDSVLYMDPDLPIEFKTHQNRITLEFLAISQNAPTGVRYKWRLKGLEESWSPPSSKTMVDYSNLQPGAYVFELLAGMENEKWSDEPVSFSFRILPPLWKQPWFLVVSIVLILGLLTGGYSIRVRRIRRREAIKRKTLEEELQRITLEQKALMLQMNPHFIFHTLNSIKELIASKDPDVARDYLTRFSKLMRRTLEDSRSAKVILEDEMEALNTYLELEQFTHSGIFDYKVICGEDIEADFLEIPSMLIQPFVENAIYHGVLPLKGGGKIHVDFKMKGEFLECTITDNGVGRQESRKSKKKEHHSTAVQVTENRLRMLNRSGGIEFIDLLDEDGKAAGLKVVLRIPLS